MIFYAVSAIVMASCGSNQVHDGEVHADPIQLDTLIKVDEPKQQKPVAVPKKKNLWNEEAVEAQLRACFAEVNRMAADSGIDVTKLDKTFCSKDFLDLKRDLEKKISKGEVMFDGDEGYHWGAGIEPPVSVDSVKTELLTRDKAQAEIWLIDEKDNHGYLEVALYLEDGVWKIHNWIDSDVYPFGSLFNWMQNVYDGYTEDDEEEELETEQE